MKRSLDNRGVIPIIAIIAGLVALGGVAAVLAYVMNNQSALADAVDEARTERAEQAEEDGYPSLWAEAGLPEYPSGTLTKTQQGSSLSDGAQVTLETSDTMSAVVSFWDAEMTSRGFGQSGFPGTEYATMVRYTSGDKLLTLQVTKIDEGPNNKIVLQYHE